VARQRCVWCGQLQATASAHLFTQCVPLKHAIFSRPMCYRWTFPSGRYSGPRPPIGHFCSSQRWQDRQRLDYVGCNFLVPAHKGPREPAPALIRQGGLLRTVAHLQELILLTLSTPSSRAGWGRGLRRMYDNCYRRPLSGSEPNSLGTQVV
jgi:hypothetical protein